MLSSLNFPVVTPSTSHLLWGFAAQLSEPTTGQPFQTSPENYDNLTTTQCQLYNWHVQLDHMNFASIQSLALKNLGISHTLAQCLLPLCQECQFGKSKHCSRTNLQPIGEHPLHPGEMCYVDHMIAGCPGLPFTAQGCCSSRCYTSCTFFVDVAT